MVLRLLAGRNLERRDRMVDVAIIGLGWWGKKLARSMEGSKLIRTICGVEPIAAATEGFAEACGFPISSSFADALADNQVKAVILATPHSMHEQQIADAAAAGKHVFCEKPLALTRKGAERSVRLLEGKNLVLGIGHERRWEPPVAEMLADARSGKLGRLLQLEANWSHDKFVALTTDNWRMSGTEAPAGGMTATGIHIFDMATALFGEAETALACTASLATKIPNGDTTCALVRYRNGCTAYVSTMMATPGISRVALFGSEGWVEVRDKGHVENAIGWIIIRCMKGGQPEFKEIPPANPVLANLEAFARAAAGEAPYPISTEEMVNNTAVMEAVFRSAKDGSLQTVPRGYRRHSG